MSRKSKSEFEFKYLHQRYNSNTPSKSSKNFSPQHDRKKNFAIFQNELENINRVNGDPFSTEMFDLKLKETNEISSRTDNSQNNTTKGNLLNEKDSPPSLLIKDEKLTTYNNLTSNGVEEKQNDNKEIFEGNLDNTRSSDIIEGEFNLNFINQIKRKERSEINDYTSNDYYIKLKIEEFNTAIYTLVSIISGLLYHELKNYGENYESFTKNSELLDKAIDACLIMVSVGVFLFSK